LVGVVTIVSRVLINLSLGGGKKSWDFRKGIMVIIGLLLWVEWENFWKKG